MVEVKREVAEDLRKEPRLGPSILEPIKIFRRRRFQGVRGHDQGARLKTLPMQQWDVEREYRRRFKKAFDARGIEIPFVPSVSLYGYCERPTGGDVVHDSRAAPGGRECVPPRN